ncbi:GNAT family N-acetyltransferase [Robiginitalea sp.]|nr:GNAT family N-acetyltransferase [Robiginitalea sp.]
MSFTIRLACKEDMPEVFRLIHELAEYENEPDAVEVTAEQLELDGFGPDPKFQCFVGSKGNEIVGIALIYERYSTWKGRVIHLEDLIVTEAARGQGLGGALLTEVIRFAQESGIKRVNWEVLDWNTPAKAFYESRGAKIKSEWKVVHLEEQGIEDYLKKYAGI